MLPLSWTDTILEPILNDIQGGTGEVFGLSLNSWTTTLGAFSHWTWQDVLKISDALISSGALVILLILTMVDLQRSMLTVDGDGEAKVRLVIIAGVKYWLLWVLFTNTQAILGAIFGFFYSLSMQTNLLFHAEASKPEGLKPFLDAVKDLDWLGQVLLVVLMLLAWLIFRGACLAGIALIVLRFVKLYIFSAFAPVSMALLASEHTRSFGIGFLRNYAATALQSFVIVMALGIFRKLSDSWLQKAIPSLDHGGVAAAFSLGGSYIFMGLVLGMLLLGSGRIANELLGG